MKIKIFTLGEIKIKYNHIELTEKEIHSEMLCKLLVYMALHRQKPVETYELINVLWQKGEIDNPAGTLKNLMYRLRNILKASFGEVEFITSGRGFYSWNSEYETEVDCESFEHFLDLAKFGSDKELMSTNLEKALKYYKGDFCPRLLNNHWIVLNNTYYHGLFLLCVHDLCKFYYDQRQFDELGLLVDNALEIDRLDEELYYYSILVCINNNALQLGLDIHNNATKLLQRELGVTNLPFLKEAYHQLLVLDLGIQTATLSNVKAEMNEEAEGGPFFCGYAVFKQIYLLEKKKIMRSKCANGTILLMTLEFPYDLSASKMERFRASKAARAFQETMNLVLRSGDVIAKYSESQYIAMLLDCSKKDISILEKRISDNFYQRYPQYVNIKIKYDFEEVEEFIK